MAAGIGSRQLVELTADAVNRWLAAATGQGEHGRTSEAAVDLASVDSAGAGA
jgi:hypothetical protein